MPDIMTRSPAPRFPPEQRKQASYHLRYCIKNEYVTRGTLCCLIRPSHGRLFQPMVSPASEGVRRLAVGASIPTLPCMTTTPELGRATILVVEDRAEVLEVVSRTLIESGYAVLTAQDGESGLAIAIDQAPDLLILDIGLPKANGLDVARELRERGFRAPVLMLTARVTVGDRVAGLDAGADDYLVKPFDVDELVARVRALLRRSTLRDEELLLRVGTLHLDTVSREVTRDGAQISLTQKEYALLEYLMKHSGRAVTREQIAEHVWKTEFDPSTNIVDVYINYLRKKIDGTGGPQLLHTVRGTGYMLRA